MLLSWAQIPETKDECSLLWSICGNGLKDTSYLFGTMHSNDARLRCFDKVWRSSFEDCDIVAGETELNIGNEDMSSMLPMLVNDSTLARVLPAAKVEVIENYLTSRVGAEMAAVLMKMQPFFIMVLMMELPDDLSEVGMVMDIYLQDFAIRQGKKVVGLETAIEQMEVISGVPIAYQAELLYEFVASDSKGNETNLYDQNDSLLIQTYLRQCLDELDLILDDLEFNERLMKQLLPMRNLRFSERLVSLMGVHSVFCAVGALHLPGDEGMIALLRSRGYVLTPIHFEFVND